MKKIAADNQVQVESLLNECKGNLFEFLVAQSLARKFQTEDRFILSVTEEFRGRLQHYEETIRQFDSNLLKNLPSLASAVAENLVKYPLFLEKKRMSFRLIGKLVATNDNELWNETDIVALEESENEVNVATELKKYFLSLKLIKDHSYTNTKSAGVKSFLERYFSSFGEVARDLQRRLNIEVDESFQLMGYKLYSMIGLEFEGSFDTRWSDRCSELPGELSEEMQKVVYANYHRVGAFLRECLGKLQELNAVQFYQSLHALCGFGNPDIIQVQCVHDHSQLKNITIKTHGDLFMNDAGEIKLKKLASSAVSFDVEFVKFTLQIRIKPMNKFTTAAYKINCSTKTKK